MSSNNQIIIMKVKRKGYEVHENCCVDNDFEPNEETLIGKAKTLEKAVKIANKYMEDNLVEYGIAVVT